jgi:GNAT superfamily N-acetyltransferase
MDVDALLRAVKDDDSTVIVARYPAEQTWIARVLADSGRTLLPTAGLVYWATNASVDSSRAPAIDVVPVATATVDVPALVEDLVREIFADYGTHYRFNPAFDPRAILDGYVEWALSCVDDPDCSILVVRDRGAVAGIATIAWDGHQRDVLLAGIRPSHQGRGIYAALLEGCRQDARRHGAERLVISTQSHNTRVQRAWARAGWLPIDAFETVHLLAPAESGTAVSEL